MIEIVNKFSFNFRLSAAVPGKNLVNLILNQTEKIHKNNRQLILNGRIKFLSVFA